MTLETPSSLENPKEHYQHALNSLTNKELVGNIGEEIGRGVQGVVYGLSRSDQVLKLFFDDEKNLLITSTEASRQEDFSDALLYAQSIGKLANVRIPDLLHRVFDGNGRLIGIVVKKVQGKSLHCIKTEEVIKKKYGVTQEVLDGMTEVEIIKQYKDDQPGFLSLEEMDGNFDPKLVEQLREISAFFEAHGLIHGDIHSGNIIIGKDGAINLIDYGKSVLNMKKASKYQHALDMGREARREKYLRGEDVPSMRKKREDDMELEIELPEFSNIDAIDIEGIELKVYHESLPRHIVDKSTAIASLRRRGMDPGFDNYFFPNLIAYDLSGGYFLVDKEIRVSNGRNEFSKEIIENILSVPPHGYIEDTSGKKLLIFAVTFGIGDILRIRTSGNVASIIEPLPDQRT